MSIDSQRRLIREAFEEHFGAEIADAVMDHLLPVPWAEVARQESLDALGVSIRGEIAQLRGEVLGELGKLDGKIGNLDGKIDAQFSKFVAANIASMIGFAGLMLAAFKIA